jgi:hypothetical protein
MIRSVGEAMAESEQLKEEFVRPFGEGAEADVV